MTAQTHRERALEVARRQGIARGRDFDAVGVPRVYLQRLRDEGVLEQVGRGLYKLAGAESQATLAWRKPPASSRKGSSACSRRCNSITSRPRRPTRSGCCSGRRTGRDESIGIAEDHSRQRRGADRRRGNHQIDGVAVPITSPAKTVADCFKHRNTIGLDVAIEALRDLLKTKTGRAGLNELWRYAAIDRIQTVMRPYIEAMTS